MVIMAGAVFLSIRLLLAAIPSIALRYPIKKWAAAGAMLGALGYLLISGAAFATVRSYIMISIMFLAVMLDRPALALRNVALAALAHPAWCGRKACSMPASRCRLRRWWRWSRPTNGCAVRDDARGGAQRRGVLGRAIAVLRRHRHLDAGGGPRGGAVRRLPFPQHAAVRDPRQPAGDPGLQSHRHAGGAGRAGGHAVRAGGGAAVADGARHRGDGVVCQRGGAPARRRRPRAGHSDLRVRADGCRRAVVGAVEHALAAAGGGADRARPDAGAHGPASRRADRARRGAGCRARRPTASCRRSPAAAPPSSWRAGWSTTAMAVRRPRPARRRPSAATARAARRR